MTLVAALSFLALALSMPTTSPVQRVQQGKTCEEGSCPHDGDGVHCSNDAGTCFVGRTMFSKCLCVGGRGYIYDPGSPEGTVPTYSDEELEAACDEGLMRCRRTLLDPDEFCSAETRPLCEAYATRLVPRAVECSGEPFPGNPTPETLTAMCCRDLGTPRSLPFLKCLAAIDTGLGCESFETAVDKTCAEERRAAGADEEGAAPRAGEAGATGGGPPTTGDMASGSGDSPQSQDDESDKGCSVTGPLSATSLLWFLLPVVAVGRSRLGTRSARSAPSRKVISGLVG